MQQISSLDGDPFGARWAKLAVGVDPPTVASLEVEEPLAASRLSRNNHRVVAARERGSRRIEEDDERQKGESLEVEIRWPQRVLV